MSLEKKINTDYITAMKAKDKFKSGTLNFLRAKIKDVRIEKRVENIEDGDVITVIKKQVKQRKDSIVQFRSAQREDLADKEQGELDILQTYLPEELSRNAVVKVVEDVLQETGATTMKDMGRVMKGVMERTAGAVDNQVVSELVKENLSKNS